MISNTKEADSQSVIIRETFGPAGVFEGNASDYNAYVSDVNFETNVDVFIRGSNSMDYPEASGGNGIELGDWSTDGMQLTVSGINTSEYTGIYLGFGIDWDTDGWGACALTYNFI